MTRGSNLTDLRFLSFTSGKHAYVRAYKNQWVPKEVLPDGTVKKAHSAPRVQMHVGALGADGVVKLSKSFLLKYPEFEGRVWYFLDHELLDEAAYRSALQKRSEDEPKAEPQPDAADTDFEPREDALPGTSTPAGTSSEAKSEPEFPESDGPVRDIRELAEIMLPYGADDEDEVDAWLRTQDAIEADFNAFYDVDDSDDSDDPDDDWLDPECNTKACLGAFALDTLAEHMGLTASLARTFGADVARALMGLVAFRALSGKSFDGYEAWARKRPLDPAAASLDKRKIEQILSTCTQASWDRFWEDRFREKAAREVDTSEPGRFCVFDTRVTPATEDTDPDARPMRLACVCDRQSGEIVHATLFREQADETQTETALFERLVAAGFPARTLLRVADRTDEGRSEGNALRGLPPEGAHFLVKCPIVEYGEDERFLVEEFPVITGQTLSLDLRYLVRVATREEAPNPGVTGTPRTFVHYYCDYPAAVKLNSALENRICALHERLNAGKRIEPAELERFKDCFVRSRNKGHEAWDFNQQEVDRLEAHSAVTVIRTDAVADAREAFGIERLRERFAAAFSSLADEVATLRVRNAEASLRSRTLVDLLLFALEVKALHRFDARFAERPGRLKLPDESIRKVLLRLDRCPASRSRSGTGRVPNAMPEHLRELAEMLFGVTEFPSRLPD